MPVNWKSFDVTYDDEKVILEWETGNEAKTQQFVVERMSQGQNFVSVGAVPASGSSLEVNKYKLADVEPESGIVYYRVKQVDMDGTFSYSEVKVVTIQDKSELSFNLYPNPANTSSNLIVELTDGSKQTVDLILYNSQGNECYRHRINNGKNSVQLPSGIVPGLYHAVVKTDNQTFNQSLVISE
jgi:hypothetical protein